MAENPRTIRVEPSTYRLVLEPLTPEEYRRVADALAPLNLGPLMELTAEVVLTEDLSAQIRGTVTNPAVSIAGRDVADEGPCGNCLHPMGSHADGRNACSECPCQGYRIGCQRCGHIRVLHTDRGCERGTARESAAGGYTTDRCACAGWVPGDPHGGR